LVCIPVSLLKPRHKDRDRQYRDALWAGVPAARVPRSAPSGRMLADDRFGLEKFTEGNLSPFTSISRHLVASERGLRGFCGAINKHHPRLKSGGHIIRAFFAC